MIYISIGSNIGNRISYLQQAITMLKNRYLKDLKCSIVLETQSILPKNAPIEWNKPFLNMVVAGHCDISPEQLLRGLKEIEHELGRPLIYKKWAPRVIDLDILLWDDILINTTDLKIPHQELTSRPFLLHLLAMMGATISTTVSSMDIESCFLKSFVVLPRLVGVVNITPDSFSDGGMYNNPNEGILKAIKLASEGASIVELGAQSTRPDACMQTAEEEYMRLKPVLAGLHKPMITGSITVGVDTFWPQVIHKVLENYPISWINDVKGELDDESLKLIASHKCNLVIMHSLSVPPEKNIVLAYDINPIAAVSKWLSEKIDRLLALGFKKDSIIIDPGIGFGKSMYHNIILLRHIEELKKLGCKVLVGHSRKSFMTAFTKEKAPDRDIETIAISAFLQNKVDFLRVHNIADHMRFFVAQTVLR
jgi:2-amino-4-hydroxy-6-hydroxymethyldihydropteridine diphosphokinase / dihydropteroate synthase